MGTWPKSPVIYEINTWIWLQALKQKYRRSVTLGSVPPEEWDAVASLEADAVWLMGVWERSPIGIRISRTLPILQAEYRKALPDYSMEDVAGSPYCVHRYVVDEHLGGPQGLAEARGELARRGMRLILDFVPNHVAPDHPWVYEYPKYFIQGSGEDLVGVPNDFFVADGKIIACGRDPYFPSWTDTAQLNAFHPGLRQAVIETVSGVADQCDGIRCDMAMLLLSSIFERTWGGRAGPRPDDEYWSEVIGAVRKGHPDFLFVAEAYWDLEWELLQQGFDYCYDKRLYDRLIYDSAENIRFHLMAEMSYQSKLVRFIENHDEPRAASTFSPDKSRAAAVTIATVPGAKLFHQGQFEGRRIKLPVQLGRQPEEPVDEDLHAFYRGLVKVIRSPAFKEGEWTLCERSGWADNASYVNLVAWCWRKGEEKYLVVINLSHTRCQGLIHVPWSDLKGRTSL
ncbi:MAG: alpha-amylase family glycosyl hydrolase, partial [Deltaproteobacteria bacterium]|nr:alpha-amylase family glycosyl hydrolase [Deltaproteobacteria bacterium]